jgi:arabinofuranan 3-O-arabinosyltransferase
MARLSSTPLDVVMTRVLGKAEPGDDEEARLDRDFLLPDSRDFRVYGVVRPDRGAPDELLDSLHGISGRDLEVTSSSRAFNGVSVRGSMAFDGDSSTGWVPGRSIRGEWLEARFPRARRVSEVVVEQPAIARGWISAADIIADGRVVAAARLSRKRVVVPIPPSLASRVRIRVTEHQGPGVPMLSEVGIAGATMKSTPLRASRRCITLGTVDGAPLRVRVVGGVGGEGPRTFQGCDPLTLGTGEHQLRSNPGWTIDSLVLRDTSGEFALAGQPGPQVTVDRQSSSSYQVVADAASTPYFLVVGQNHHPLWRATMDGVDLGPAEVIDGYAMGWRVDDLGPHAFTIRYSPQGASDVALGVSAAALLGSAALIAVPGRRRPLPERRRAGSRSASRRSLLLRWRRRGAWLDRSLFVAGCWFFAGGVGLTAGALALVWIVLGSPRPRTLLHLATGAMTLVPVAWVLGNLHQWGEVSPQLVLGNQAPSVLAIVSLVLLVLGSWGESDREDGR